jgi:hypothetical protein
VYALYEALLLAALGVDRGRSRVLGLFAAHGERDAGECRGEGGYRELHVTGLVSPMFNSTPKYAHCIFCDRSKLPSLSFFAQSIAEAYPELRGMLIALFLLNNAFGRTYDVRADLAAHNSVHGNHLCGIRGIFGP